MDVLVVDDEVGIREGMASFLRLKGHRVLTAGTSADALALLDSESFDAVVTDWQLADANASAVVHRATVPCFVISGHPDAVPESGEMVRVLAKPVLPDRLRAMLEEHVVVPAAAQHRSGSPATRVGDYPVDTVDRIELVRQLCGPVVVFDDGEFVAISADLPDESTLALLEPLGGDLRVTTPFGSPRVELRLFRDGRPDGIAATVAPSDDWESATGPVAIDFDREECHPAAFLALLDRVAASRQSGRDVCLLNVPHSLRLCVEALGRSSALPKRPVSGPCLPEVLSQLWS